MEELDEVREEIREIDEELAGLVRQRVDKAREAGRLKREHGTGVRDYEVERAVVDRMRSAFENEELAPETGENVARLLIGEALRAQERDGMQPAKGSRGRALVVGGAGKMGTWLCHFLSGVGYEVIVHDLAGPLEGYPYTTDARGTAENVDLVLVATPPAATGEVLDELVGVNALVMDIASLKTPIEEQLKSMAQTHPVTSVHPLWGPKTRVLSDKNVLVLDCGNAEANRQAIELFQRTAANVVEMPLDEHDRNMAFTLNLPHALNLVYAEVLAESGREFETLAQCGGPTFLKQTDVAAEVAAEDPDLYRQIQALNAASPEVYEDLREAVERFTERVDDPETFRETMNAYNEYFDGRPGWVHP